ncbi:LuxR family transcriptional regulator [Actinoplanes italicus]|uniref:AAA ATPase-like protein n=1 Tax=Actinoplanes italicus TaxID=113567 RepID=A0A2T0KFQ1_9ACTN|nr:helix-turn-helix transcriptional regulator [Actinoplanes italicus]PRX22196.1 AAA ATPase-like protein [Actinoplanes italicus]GIE29383.1 LuxR family transcriptional regulator [Actinoplanes italicus]
MLVGRDVPIAAVTALIDQAQRQAGGAVVLCGEAGIGKSTILSYGCELAAARGVRVAAVAGVQAEVHIPYAGLHRLWWLLGGDRSAGGTGIESPYTAAMTLLALIGSRDEPALIAVEDAHWLDRGSWEALTFAARRLGSEPVAMVLTIRDGEDVDRLLAQAGLPEQRLEPLTPADSGTLLDTVAPGLSPPLRDRVLAQAAGNPLGLVELGQVAATSGGAALLPSWLPLSTRVERTFTALVAELPPATRSLLLVAALDDGDGLDEILAAGSRFAGRPVTVADIEPAVTTRLVRVDDTYRLRFRHPLLRSALYQSAGVADRRRVHAALAEVIATDLDRRVWHRAGAAAGPDEALARELTETATRAGDRQAASVALAAFQRAVQLSEDPAERGRRLLAAAEVASEQGDIAAARQLIDDVAEEHLRPADQAWLSYLREAFFITGWSGTARLMLFAELIDALRRDGDQQRAIDALIVMSLRFYWSNPPVQTIQAYLAVADEFDSSKENPRLTAAVGLIAPVQRGAVTLERMTQLRARFDLTPAEQQHLGLSAGGIGALPLSAQFFSAAVAGIRAQGRVGVLAQLLTSQAFTAACQGDTRMARPTAAEAAALAAETGQPAWTLTAHLTLGHAHALAGDTDAALDAADRAEQVLLPGGRLPMLALVQLIRGVAALAAGRPADAYAQLCRIFDPGDVAHHAYLPLVTFGHLIEAAIWSGQEEALRAQIDRLSGVARESASPSLVVALRYAEAVLSGDGRTYEAALAADLSEWPFERARLERAYGGWLRRRRRSAESRPLLRSAAATFDALGAAPWAERARAELRASGESLRRAGDDAGSLTLQEQQIARLAADGLSNKEIAERLFLSPRTISTHLYRIYPKLGIKSRGELAQYVDLRTRTDAPQPYVE